MSAGDGTPKDFLCVFTSAAVVLRVVGEGRDGPSKRPDPPGTNRRPPRARLTGRERPDGETGRGCGRDEGSEEGGNENGRSHTHLSAAPSLT